ncbi:hypothetical protein ACIGZJ_31185 [Kitasatospora sp. NPDC052868]|uniref:hypothetical protein n=1 Tax=Kitasatospora sp. NPDC052868 TaxID=3364060 RepID=UPI0037C6BC45
MNRHPAKPFTSQTVKDAAARWRARRHSTPPPSCPPPADPVRIAVLEHDLLGIPPEPGSLAALVIAMRRITTCTEHQPVDVTGFGDPLPNAICSGCGQHLVRTHDEWRTT